jgi:hypothetical protein
MGGERCAKLNPARRPLWNSCSATGGAQIEIDATFSVGADNRRASARAHLAFRSPAADGLGFRVGSFLNRLRLQAALLAHDVRFIFDGARLDC